VDLFHEKRESKGKKNPKEIICRDEILKRQKLKRTQQKASSVIEFAK
jgi:hypothetical protein